jgi:hypothetical protein
LLYIMCLDCCRCSHSSHIFIDCGINFPHLHDFNSICVLLSRCVLLLCYPQEAGSYAHDCVYPARYITGGQTGKKKATAHLQSLVSTVHANILSRLFCLLFTHFLPLFSPSFHPVFTPFLSFSIAFAPNNLIDRR